jgi:hypothetical protein
VQCGPKVFDIANMGRSVEQLDNRVPVISVNTSHTIREQKRSQAETRRPQVPCPHEPLTVGQVTVREPAWTGTVAVPVAAAPEKVAARSKLRA